MSRRTVTRCAHCKRRIRNYEPDLILEHLEDNHGRPRFFHTTCGGAAYTAAAQEPAVYRLTVRHVQAVAN